MINRQIINPKSIVVVGGSNHLHKPGGRIIENLLDGKFKGELHVVNPKSRTVQGIEAAASVEELPDVDMAILSIPAKYCLETVTYLARNKNTKAFIIISAGFGEVYPEGKLVEKQLAAVVNETGGCLFGPNCIGVITEHYSGVFTPPIPVFHQDGCDFISASGSTALFIIEAGIPRGLRFANVFTVGNSAHTNVEDVLEYLDDTFDPEKSSKIKLLYLENISNPAKLLKHAISLVRKGCKIAAIKSGATDDGKRATASHTGAMANSDVAVRALFRKAGVVYCSSREELITVAAIFSYKKLEGKNIAIITHAGGSAVMLTDALSRGGLKVPLIEGPHAEELKTYLAPGSSVSNPIDFLATGNAEQLGIIIDYCEHLFDHIDAMIVLFGSAGLFDVENVYKVLNVKLAVCKKPIYPILPSLINAQKEIQYFLSKGHVNFPDEVSLGRALAEVYHTPPPFDESTIDLGITIDEHKVHTILEDAGQGFLPPAKVKAILEAVDIKVAPEYIAATEAEAVKAVGDLGFPLAIKVVGPVHKSDLGGVALNIYTEADALKAFNHMMSIEGATGTLIQPMLDGVELFIGAKHESAFGHVIMCGIGGIFVEIFKDVRAGLAPIDTATAKRMIHKLKGYPLIKGARGRMGVDETALIALIQGVSALVKIAPEIVEMDINPIIGKGEDLTAVDARIKIQKTGL
jgi:acyl-CoA synthetase (NDP forming)